MEKELEEFLAKNPVFAGETIVLEKTENSELVEELKPSTAHFFEKVFDANGPYWNAYKALGFGETPTNSQYLAIANNQMYFCKNVEKRFLYSTGLAKKYFYEKNTLKEKTEISPQNFLMLFSTPFNFARQTATIALASIRINEELEKFSWFSEKSKQFWQKHSNQKILDPKELAAICIEGALESMKYSFFASFAYSLKIKLRQTAGWKNCELEELSKLAAEEKTGTIEKIQKDFGFYSKNPYDISSPAFFENPAEAKFFKTAKFPENPAARWRENCKFLCARYLAILRKCYLQIGEKEKLGKSVFFLTPQEFSAKNTQGIIEEREKKFEETKNKPLPKTLVFDGKWNFESIQKNQIISGQPAGGSRIAVGEISFVDREKDFQKNLAGKIIFSKTLSPNLVVLFDRIEGIISAGGGMTAHTSIVALEQGLPCIVQAKNWELLKEGEKVKINGASGKIEKIE